MTYKVFILFFITYFLSIADIKAQSDSTSNPEIDKVLSFVQTVEDNNNFLDQLSPDSNVALPFGIIKQIGSARYIIAIDSCKFKPNGAYFNAYAAIDFPGTTKKIAFEAMNIKFNPKGVVGGNQARLMLVSEHTIKINNTVSLKLVPDGNNWVEWDCNGFKNISLKGEFIFANGKLKPDTTQTSEKVVKAIFQFTGNDIHNFIADVSITPFTMEGLNNWSFSVSNATVDMSELMNAPTMTFPIGYNNPNMITPQMWTGFHLKSLKVRLPSEISKTGKRTEIVVSNLLIDHMGVSGLFQVNNIFGTKDGSMSGWGFSVDELGVGFVCNQLNSGHVKGRVNIPIMDSTQTLIYDANVCYNPINKEIDYNFVISPANNLQFKVFSAEVNLNSNSHISIMKTNGVFKPSAVLNGYIAFNNAKFNSNGGQLLFQDLTIVTTAPYLTNGIFTLHNIGNQTKAANYPISINDISFGISNGAPVMGFSVTINLKEGSAGFSAGTLVNLKGKIDAEQVTYNDDVPVNYTKTKWKFDRVSISGISLGIHTSVFTLDGTVIFRDNDPVYGDGFFGSITMGIAGVIPPVQITCCFGSLPTYRYFYVDAAVPVNIPLGNIPITLTRLMGGLYYHMSPMNSTQAQLINASVNQSATQSNALSYVPDENMGIGFKAGVGFKYTPSAKTANGDVMLEVAFTSSGGLGFIKLGGDIYIMAEPNERPKAPIKGSILVVFDAVNSVFDANASIVINAYNVVTGTGSTKIHIEPGMWYVCAGKPNSPNNINILGQVNATSYFMVGNSIEPASSPPQEILDIIGQGASLPERDNNSLASGSGFCTGARIFSNFDKQIGLSDFSIHAAYSFGLGFDMMMLNYGKNGYCSGTNDKIGMNGWLAEGSMYLWMSGSLRINGSVPMPAICYSEIDGPPYPCGSITNPQICRDKINLPYPCIENRSFDQPIFEAAVAAMVQGKLPKPLYFRGDFVCSYNVFGILKGDYQFNYEYGNNCNPVPSF